VRQKALELLINLKNLGINIQYTSGFRSPEEQQKLYEEGRTEPGKIVTHAKPLWSFHNYGLAVDLVPLKDGKPWWKAPYEIWEKIGIEAEKLGFIWGGRWLGKKKDMPHIEYHPGLTISEIRNYFLKTGKVLIEKGLAPVAVIVIAIGVLFLAKYVRSRI